jgi:hypothetical protein
MKYIRKVNRIQVVQRYVYAKNGQPLAIERQNPVHPHVCGENHDHVPYRVNPTSSQIFRRLPLCCFDFAQLIAALACTPLLQDYLNPCFPDFVTYFRPFQVTPWPESTFQVEANSMTAKRPAPSGMVKAYQPGIFISRNTSTRQKMR